MAKGRNRKQGKRTQSGRLSRAGEPRFDKGNDKVQSLRARYGEHYNSALGRAFAAGLLGKDQDAADRLNEGKRFARVYAKVLDRSYRCALDTTPRGSSGEHDHEHEQAEQDWLIAMCKKLDDAGLRPWLDQLLSPVWTDAGPVWLDRVLAGGRHKGDMAVLNCALAALDLITPKRKPIGILSVAA